MPRTKRFVLPGLTVLLLAALVIAACGAPAAPSAPAEAEAPATEASAAEEPAAEAAATEAPAAEEPPAEPNEAAAEAAPAEAEAPTAQARQFVVDPARSEASYEVDEEFLGRNVSFVQTVGRTNSIEGNLSLTLNGSSLQLGENEFVVDLRTLTSDQPRRDRAIQRDWLQSELYPFAHFRATEVANLPADAALGRPVGFQLVGEMTIREITQPLTWNVTATLDGGTLNGTAQTNLLMRDFGFEPPDIAGMLRVTDGVTVTVNFAADEAQ